MDATTTETNLEIDWMQCELIEQIPGKVSGRPIVRGTRILPDAIVDSYDLGVFMGTLCPLMNEIFPKTDKEAQCARNSYK